MPTPAPSKPAEAPTTATVASLLDKGDGILLRRNGYWTYPACPNDRSGTNLVMPTEFVSEAAVQDAIAKGDIVVTAIDGNGSASSVSRSASGGGRVRFVNPMQAGSVDAATELPLNSRPTHDAGRSEKEVDVAQVQQAGPASKVAMPAGSVVPAAGPTPPAATATAAPAAIAPAAPKP